MSFYSHTRTHDSAQRTAPDAGNPSVSPPTAANTMIMCVWLWAVWHMCMWWSLELCNTKCLLCTMYMYI